MPLPIYWGFLPKHQIFRNLPTNHLDVTEPYCLLVPVRYTANAPAVNFKTPSTRGSIFLGGNYYNYRRWGTRNFYSSRSFERGLTTLVHSGIGYGKFNRAVSVSCELLANAASILLEAVPVLLQMHVIANIPITETAKREVEELGFNVPHVLWWSNPNRYLRIRELDAKHAKRKGLPEPTSWGLGGFNDSMDYYRQGEFQEPAGEEHD